MSKVDLRITNLPKEIHPECEAVITHYGVNLGKLLLVDIIAAIHSIARQDAGTQTG